MIEKTNKPLHTVRRDISTAPKKQIRGNTYQYSKFGNKKPARLTEPTDSKNTRPRRASNIIPDLGQNIRIVPLGGCEEIGKNMTAIEIGNDIIIIDAGMQFKTDDTPGIDYIIPNTTYLEERKDKIRAVFITHGHLDHIGGVPLVMSRIGNPPIYSRELSCLLMKKRQAEFPHLPPLKLQT